MCNYELSIQYIRYIQYRYGLIEQSLRSVQVWIAKMVTAIPSVRLLFKSYAYLVNTTYN
jgi:hypothetical protein